MYSEMAAERCKKIDEKVDEIESRLTKLDITNKKREKKGKKQQANVNRLYVKMVLTGILTKPLCKV